MSCFLEILQRFFLMPCMVLECCCFAFVCFVLLVLRCGFKKCPNRITTPFQRFPDMVLLLPVVPQRCHLCPVVQGLYNTQLELWRIKVVLYNRRYWSMCVLFPYTSILRLLSASLCTEQYRKAQTLSLTSEHDFMNCSFDVDSKGFHFFCLKFNPC